MSEAVIGLVGALVGGIAALGGAVLQARTAERHARADAERRARESFQLLARRYLFQLQEAVDSLHSRIDNWAHAAGQEYSELRDPGYWQPTTLYAFGRALGAERILALEGVYVQLEQVRRRLPPLRVERAVQKAMGGRVFFYHLLALAESVLDREPEGFRLLTYTEFRRRYDDPQSGIQQYLKPVVDALSDLERDQVERFEAPLAEISEQLAAITAGND